MDYQLNGAKAVVGTVFGQYVTGRPVSASRYGK